MSELSDRLRNSGGQITRWGYMRCVNVDDVVAAADRLDVLDALLEGIGFCDERFSSIDTYPDLTEAQVEILREMTR